MVEIEVTTQETEKIAFTIPDEAIEDNIKNLMKLHSNQTQLIRTLQNTAIDNAFQELSSDVETLKSDVADLKIALQAYMNIPRIKRLLKEINGDTQT